MQIFIIGSPLETAKALDKKRLNKQIIEAKQIIMALNGETKAWANHPVVKMYEDPGPLLWLRGYLKILENYKEGRGFLLKFLNKLIHSIRPDFQTQEYFDQMKRRLYTKDNAHYAQWAHLGISEVNWYWSPKENKWIYYKNKKKTNEAV